MTSAYLIASATTLLGLGIVAATALKGWQGWLALKTRELDLLPHQIEGTAGTGMARIELSDLKERIRKLEAIADGMI
uniref:Uncharacterized protein n=1 Tax=uncultured bacterium 5H7 TaxID=1701327 RepID=A0A0N9HQI3_9BACT|nr:hypothetical protein 5H7_003 [uncultured bacterium 5H7]